MELSACFIGSEEYIVYPNGSFAVATVPQFSLNQLQYAMLRYATDFLRSRSTLTSVFAGCKGSGTLYLTTWSAVRCTKLHDMFLSLSRNRSLTMNHTIYTKTVPSSVLVTSNHLHKWTPLRKIIFQYCQMYTFKAKSIWLNKQKVGWGIYVLLFRNVADLLIAG